MNDQETLERLSRLSARIDGLVKRIEALEAGSAPFYPIPAQVGTVCSCCGPVTTGGTCGYCGLPKPAGTF